MKPILLIPIVVGMMVIPSSESLDSQRPRSAADIYTRSYSEQFKASSVSPGVSEFRAAEYAARYTSYDQHHEVVQTSGHSGVVSPRQMM